MINKETLRYVLWNALPFAALTTINIRNPKSCLMFELSPSCSRIGEHKVKCVCHYYRMFNGPSCQVRSIPASGTPVALRRRGIDLDDTGWSIDASDMRNALDSLKMLIQFRTGEKSE